MNRINFLNKNDSLNQVVTIKDKLLFKNNVNEPDNKVKIEPLSYSQQQMWIIDQMQPGNHAYNLPVGFYLKGDLNVQVLEQSINEIIKRHESLRSTFGIINNETRQFIHPECQVPIKLINFEDDDSRDRKQKIDSAIWEEVTNPFDLTKLPLIRILIIRLTKTENILVLNMHHIISDGWSVGIMLNELSELYNNYVINSTTQLPDLQAQFSDYVHWQLQNNWNPSYSEQLKFWEEQLAGTLPILEFPSTNIRPAVQSLNGSNEFFKLPTDIAQRIQSIGLKKGCSFFMTILSVFQVLLNKYTGVEDVIIGTPISNRPRKEDEKLIGNFLNTVPLRNNLSDNPDFESLLQRTQKMTLDALKHRDLPFEKIVETLRIERDLSRNPIFQVMIQVLPKYTFELSGLQTSNYEFDLGYSQFDLSLHLYQVEEGYNCRIEYDTDIFDKPMIERMVSNFKKLIDEIVEDPSKRISEYSAISDHEIKLLDFVNQTETKYSRELCVHQLFELQAEQRINSIAAKFSNEVLTYDELNSSANKLANYLLKQGIKKGDYVGICLDRSINMLVGLLGIIKAGAAYIPLDPAFPVERLNFIIKDSGIEKLLTEKKLSDLTSNFNINKIFIDSDWKKIKKENAGNLNLDLSPSDLMYIIYTSGSTGKPKGVMIEHRSVVNFLESMKVEPGFSENDNMLAITTMSFDISVLELFLPIIVGGTVVIADKAVSLDGKALVKLIDQNCITTLQATPSTWKIMIESGWKGNNNLRMFCGGESFSTELSSELLKRGFELWNMYGPTETTIWSSVSKIEKDDTKILIGNPIANTSFYVVDKNLNPVPIGVEGELVIGGEGLARGYLNRDELTKEKFVKASVLYYDGRLYRTGDIVKYNVDGKLEFLGRTDQQVKVRGFRIELGEIETRLIEFDNIQEAVVTINETKSGEKKLVAFLKLNHKNGFKIDSLINHLKSKIPDYMIPSFFIEIDYFPLTPNGKIDRKALPKPDSEIIMREEKNGETSSSLQESIKDIWQDVLEIRNIGRKDNFFAIGGTSLLAIRMIYQLNEKFKINLPLSIIFETPTISKLANEIENSLKITPN